MIGKLEGEVGPQNPIRTEQVAPVSKRKKMGCPHTTISIRNFLLVMAVVRSGEFGPLQSAIAKPRRSVGGLSGGDVPLFCVT